MAKLPKISGCTWKHIQTVKSWAFRCGYCDREVASDKGWNLNNARSASGKATGALRVCPWCNGPNFLMDNFRSPASAFGRPVADVPKDISALYEEARRCTRAECDTAAVLACRKILMHIAVDQGAGADLSFKKYVEYLAEKGFVPPNGMGWVDAIRSRGNEANHEIVLMGRDDSRDLITLVEMLLRFIYEFPAKAPIPDAE